jgi:hypothetical protein
VEFRPATLGQVHVVSNGMPLKHLAAVKCYAIIVYTNRNRKKEQSGVSLKKRKQTERAKQKGALYIQERHGGNRPNRVIHRTREDLVEHDIPKLVNHFVMGTPFYDID